MALRTTFVNATQPFTDSFTIRRPSNASPLVGTTGFLPWIVLAAIGGGAAIVGFQLKIRARPKPANGRSVPPPIAPSTIHGRNPVVRSEELTPELQSPS